MDAENGYHGLIREDELVVEVKPKIRAVGAELCGFRIINRHQHGDLPFVVSTPFLSMSLVMKDNITLSISRLPRRKRIYAFDSSDNKIDSLFMTGTVERFASTFSEFE